jgi:hypothetical protein
MADEIRLTLPRERPFFGIAHLVLGGLAVRLDVTFETLEDLQLALENLLGEAEVGGEVTLSVRVAGDELRASVGPFTPTELARLGAHAGSEELTIGRVLDTLVDDVAIDQRDGARWVDVTKTLRRTAA